MFTRYLRYNWAMEIGQITRSLFSAIGHIFDQVTNGVADETEASPLDRPLGDGSEMMGDYNFRTDKIDCGTDPFGWYED